MITFFFSERLLNSWFAKPGCATRTQHGTWSNKRTCHSSTRKESPYFCRQCLPGPSKTTELITSIQPTPTVSIYKVKIPNSPIFKGPTSPSKMRDRFSETLVTKRLPTPRDTAGDRRPQLQGGGNLTSRWMTNSIHSTRSLRSLCMWHVLRIQQFQQSTLLTPADWTIAQLHMFLAQTYWSCATATAYWTLMTQPWQRTIKKILAMYLT